MAINFNDDLKTGILKIDIQHKELFEKVNVLYQACLEGRGKEEILKTMTYLKKYVSVHFDTEEEYMSKHLYSNLNAHKAAHKAFITAYENLVKDFEKEGNSANFIIKVNKTLINWLLQHLSTDDKHMADFLRNKIDK